MQGKQTAERKIQKGKPPKRENKKKDETNERVCLCGMIHTRHGGGICVILSDFLGWKHFSQNFHAFSPLKALKQKHFSFFRCRSFWGGILFPSSLSFSLARARVLFSSVKLYKSSSRHFQAFHKASNRGKKVENSNFFFFFFMLSSNLSSTKKHREKAQTYEETKKKKQQQQQIQNFPSAQLSSKDEISFSQPPPSRFFFRRTSRS